MIVNRRREATSVGSGLTWCDYKQLVQNFGFPLHILRKGCVASDSTLLAQKEPAVLEAFMAPTLLLVPKL
jgi:hypothetical protein